MRALSSSELLQVWEQGLGLSSVDRALILLGSAGKDCPEDDPAKCSVGERDARLLTLREFTFGPEISAVVHCPNCADALELHFRVDDLRVRAGDRPQFPLTLAEADYEVKFRLPNSLDLRALQSALGEVVDAQRQLLKRCLAEATCKGVKVRVEQLPETIVEAISERMSQADPQADVELSLECIQCRHQWQESFDIEAFFWAEIHAWAGRMLNEIHRLASAYGWSEAEILGVSALRRNHYLNLIVE